MTFKIFAKMAQKPDPAPLSAREAMSRATTVPSIRTSQMQRVAWNFLLRSPRVSFMLAPCTAHDVDHFCECKLERRRRPGIHRSWANDARLPRKAAGSTHLCCVLWDDGMTSQSNGNLHAALDEVRDRTLTCVVDRMVVQATGARRKVS
jgi:hypothetical protein